MITVKTEKDLAKMREACRIVKEVHLYVEQFVKAGVSTAELDRKAEEFILKNGAKPNFKNYHGYPATACISVNDVVVHGIPSEKIILQEGDIVSIDLGAEYQGFHGDAARTHGVGKISAERQRLIDKTRESFFEGIKNARAGRRLGDVSHSIQAYVEKNGYSVVRALVGHGIGRKLHEDPSVPNFGAAGQGVLLKAGYTLAIEPMVNAGAFGVKFGSDGWTCRTVDGSDSAHYENTILVTGGEPQILTL